MSRARPNAIAPEPAAATAGCSRGAEADHHHHHQERPVVLTVWRKSLLPNCSGFTVFDASGALAFRVDCYGSARSGLRGLRRRSGEVVLMDVAGTPLLTVRRQSRLTSLGLAPDRWVIFDGDGAGCHRPTGNKAKPLLSVRRARLGLGLGLGASASSGKAPLHATDDGDGEEYVVEGSYGARPCAVRDARGDAVAEVRRKERVGDDVFRLVAGPRLGAPLAMALVTVRDVRRRRWHWGLGVRARVGVAAVPAPPDVVGVVLVISDAGDAMYAADQSRAWTSVPCLHGQPAPGVSVSRVEQAFLF